MRKLDFKRKLVYAILKPVIKLLIWIIWKTCRITSIQGEKHIQQLVSSGTPFIPCYWHQQHIFGAWYLLQQVPKGLKLGFLISPSVDGEVPAKIVESWGAKAIRGSSTRTGARAMRDLYQVMAKDGISPVNTSDGPTGPIFKFKPGAVMLAQLTQYPMLPMAYAAENAWYLNSWDRFVIPKPFSRIAIAVGEPRYVDKQVPMQDQSAIATQMETSLNTLTQQCRDRFEKISGNQ